MSHKKRILRNHTSLLVIMNLLTVINNNEVKFKLISLVFNTKNGEKNHD